MITHSLTKRSLAILHDLCAVVLCWFLAYWLRFNLEVSGVYMESAGRALIPVMICYVPACWFFGLYRGIWRYASLMDLRRIIVAVACASVVAAAAIYMLHLPGVPR